jgi:DNA modification methylase
MSEMPMSGFTVAAGTGVSGVRILNADVFDGLSRLESASVDCVVTSPPYWGLRDYGTGSWIGGDPDCEHRSPSMREGREEARPVLSGSPATNSAQLIHFRHSSCGKCGAIRQDCQIGLEESADKHVEVLKRVFAEVRRVLKPEGTHWINYGDGYATSPNGNTHLTHDGRYRSKRDDRTHTDKPFSTVGGGIKRKDLLLVSAKLAQALRDDGWWLRADVIWVKPNPKPESIKDRPTQAYEHVFLFSKSERYYYDAEAVREPHVTPRRYRSRKHGRQAFRGQESLRARGNMEACSKPEDRYFHEGGRNLRNVWVIPTEPYPGAHFATMPLALASLCIRAGCPERGIVLDPFGGAGSTAVAASRLGRESILIELNPDFCDMARRRCAEDRLIMGCGTMADVAAAGLEPTPIEAYIAAAAA